MTQARAVSSLRLPRRLIFAAIFALLITSRFGIYRPLQPAASPPHKIGERVEIK